MQISLKKKLKKGTFSGVIPMMGMFIMAALMAFQSVPIGQAVGNELTASFSDLSRIAETKSYGDLYFFNFVPNGAEHSLNNVSHSLAKNGGDVSWSYNDFDAENDIRPEVESKLSTIIGDKLEPMTENYFNEKYGGVSQGSGCTIYEINYTTIPLPDSDNNYVQGVQNNPEDIPMIVRSQVETSGYFNVDAAPMEVECANDQGATKYIGDTQTDSDTTSTTSTGVGTGGLGLGSFGFGGLGIGFLPGDWTSVGYTNKVEATANRFHVLANRTTYIYKRVHDNWVNNVEEVSNTEEDVCDPSDSDWQSVESETVNDVNSDVTDQFNNVVNSEVDIEGVSGQFDLETYALNFDYDDYTKNYLGEASYSTSDHEDCDCDTCYDSDGDPYDCNCDTEKDLTVTVTPNASIMRSNITDDDFKVNTAEGWKNLKFTVENYNHDFQDDD
ncbi:hypothetical protein AQV86_05780 [Nanohaloarchaea archaeon SG9]|nr:hypothetical protein AQV86_05780 [Nanohaloarchaea archaeon SG9]